jgi:hypothetical protein
MKELGEFRREFSDFATGMRFGATISCQCLSIFRNTELLAKSLLAFSRRNAVIPALHAKHDKVYGLGAFYGLFQVFGGNNRFFADLYRQGTIQSN